MSANSGTPYYKLREILHEKLGNGLFEDKLRKLCPYANYTAARDLQLFGLSFKQCPVCAKELYHTYIYNAPWLEKCPIHHVALTNTCPECGRPWPKVTEITKRECNSCGTVLVKDLPFDSLKDIQNKYWPIKEIYRILDHQEDALIEFRRHDYRRYIWNIRSTIWKPATPADLLYPSLKIDTVPDFSIDKAKKLHIWITPVHKYGSAICRREINLWVDPVELVDQFFPIDTPSYYLTNYAKSRDAINHRVMNDVLGWIGSHTNRNHTISIVDYRNYGFNHWENHPHICPYCMALSVWYFYIASSQYGFKFWFDANDFPLFKALGLNYFNDPSPFNDFKVYDQKLKKHGTYHLSQSFHGWLYARGLQILFLQIFYFFELLSKEVPKEINYSEFANKYNNQISQKIIDNIYYPTIKFGMLNYYCLPNNPIDHYNNNEYRNIDLICNGHHEFLDRITYTPLYESIAIKKYPLSRENYRDLRFKFLAIMHQHFKCLMSKSYFSYNYKYLDRIENPRNI